MLPGIWMHQRTQRTPVNHQPGNKSPKLRRREDVHLEHTHRVRTHGLIDHTVDAQFGELTTDAFVQGCGIGLLRGRGVLEVDMDVEAASGVVCERCNEGGVGWAGC